MVGGRALPNLGLKSFFDFGEDGWNDEIDLNFLLLSVLVQGGALDFVSATPGSPADGDVYLFDETHPTEANKIAIRDDGAWVYVTPLEGWRIWDRTANKDMRFDGTVWAEVVSGGGGGGATDIDDLGDVDTTTVAPTVGDVLEWDGTNWVAAAPSGGGGGGSDPVHPVDLSGMPSLAWVNQGSAVWQTNANGSESLILPTDTSDNMRGKFAAAPGTPYEYLVGFIPNMHKISYHMIGPAFRDSASGKMVPLLAYQDNSNSILWLPANYNSPTSKNGNVSAVSRYHTVAPMYFRFGDNGTDRYCYVGFDPYMQDYPMYRVGRTNFLTADQIGFVGANVYLGGSEQCKLSANIFKWVRTI